ncbi:hypothetical protein MCC93_18010 [Morococcus cerebrosus]|uniref:Uncharacterized protein n=1 Tax=Morococcus cerebrosus TaxID=1056807 RepID=A0A0C1GK07_9NEIS|nr:hypothetical protein MCC93_18010 [Morococcus cerebrosus]
MFLLVNCNIFFYCFNNTKPVLIKLKISLWITPEKCFN